MARTEGVEPSSTVLETAALPLNYIRIWCSQRDSNSYAIKHQLLRLTCLPLPSQEQNFGGVDWIWTSDNGVADRFLNRLDTTPPTKWLGRLDSNQSMQKSKSCALPAWLHPNIWWSQLELNQHYKNFQSFALPAELWDHIVWTKVVGRAGFEPAVFLTSRVYGPLASTSLHIYPEWCCA